MAKRGAASDLNHTNWDVEEEPEEAGTFLKASTDVMQSRVVKKAKRRGPADESKAGKPVFGGFGGLMAKAAPPPKDEPQNTALTFGGSVSFGAAKTPLFSGASSLNGAEDKGMKGDARDSSSYFHALKSLNEGVLAWIKQHVEDNPYIFLTPIFKDYETHLAAIEAKRSASSPPAGVAPKKDLTKTVESSTPVKPISSNTTAKSELSSEAGSAKVDEEKPACKGFSFGLATTTQPESKPAPFGGLASSNGGFKFSTSSSTPGFSFGAPKSSDTAAAPGLGKPAFSFGSTAGPGSSLFGAVGSSTSASQGNSQAAETKDDEEYEPPKPEVKEIKEEDALYSKRCKLYFQREGQWVDRGIGNVHLKPVADNKTQLLIRADTNLGNILLNVMLSSSMPVSRQGKNNVSLACIPNPPLSSKPDDEDKEKPVPMLIRVKTAEDADELYGKIDERVQLLSS